MNQAVWLLNCDAVGNRVNEVNGIPLESNSRLKSATVRQSTQFTMDLERQHLNQFRANPASMIPAAAEQGTFFCFIPTVATVFLDSGRIFRGMKQPSRLAFHF